VSERIRSPRTKSAPTWCGIPPLKKLVYLDGQQVVLYCSKMNPFLGRNFEAQDPLEWLARISDHIVLPRTAPEAPLRRVRQPRPGRAPGRARTGHDSRRPAEETLLPKLGAAHYQGLPGWIRSSAPAAESAWASSPS
jgi:hypothetical protein